MHTNLAIKTVKTLKTTNFGNRFSIDEKLVRLPDGKETIFFVRNSEPYAVVIAKDMSEKFVMVRQFRVGIGKETLEFPMGNVKNADPSAMAKIELKEETGFQADSFVKVGEFLQSPARANTVAHVFYTEKARAGNPKPEPYEFIAVELYKEEEIIEMIRSAAIVDASTIVAWHLFQVYQSHKALPQFA